MIRKKKNLRHKFDMKLLVLQDSLLRSFPTPDRRHPDSGGRAHCFERSSTIEADAIKSDTPRPVKGLCHTCADTSFSKDSIELSDTGVPHLR